MLFRSLVKTVYSLISAGTEKFSVTTTKASLLQRAKQQPEQFQLVIDNLKKEGILSTIEKVRSKLDSYKTLGYSSAGIVIESKCSEFQVGNYVACGGAGLAVHSEIVAIPKNLAVKIPEGVDFQDAAYTTVGSIAIQGIRQADLRLGENVAVIGLGLLGQLTVQMLKASGCRVIGIDVNEGLFGKAKSFGCDATYLSNKDCVNPVKSFTNGIGCDAVIITASANSNQPIELAIELARKKGKVVIVGAVDMNIQRNPFYVKELDITISCSYGPGRYDPDYEDRGNDYPYAYVRWTENRNMQAVLDLLQQKKLDTKSLTSHIFPLSEASNAYQLLTGERKEEYLGILIEYPEKKSEVIRIVKLNTSASASNINVGFIGAGAFAQSYLLPFIKEHKVSLHTVSTAKPVNAITVGKKFNFLNATTNNDEILNNSEINVVFCATLHDTHFEFVRKSLENGKAVFVEKPLEIGRAHV